MATTDENICLSTECVDNPYGFGGVIVTEKGTYPIFSHQGRASRDGQGPHSSVEKFQCAHHGADPETIGDSNSSNVAPPDISTDEEVPMEVDQQE